MTDQITRTVCGTCNGCGNCMDCDTLSMEAAQAELADAKHRALYAVLPHVVTQFDERIADLEAYIARHTTPAQPAAPEVEPTERLATLLGAAQRREAGTMSAYYELEADVLAAYPAVETLTAYTLRVLGEQPAPVVEAALEATTQPNTETHSDDILAQLSYINSHDHGYTAQQIAHAAADEIRRLRDQLAGVQADPHECERARRATDEAFAGNSAAYTAQVEQLTAELAALKATTTPRVVPTRWVQGWGYKAEVFIGETRVYLSPHWYNDKNEAIKYAQAFADTLTAELNAQR